MLHTRTVSLGCAMALAALPSFVFGQAAPRPCEQLTQVTLADAP